MPVIFLILGILTAGAGIAAIGFGISIKDLPIGPTLIIAGTTALVGGLLLVGFSAAVSELARIVEAVRPRPGLRGPARPVAAAEAIASHAVPALSGATASASSPRQIGRAPAAQPPVPEFARAETPLRSEVEPPGGGATSRGAPADGPGARRLLRVVRGRGVGGSD